MAGLVHSIEELVGRTPLMELDRFERQQQCGAHLLAKLESIDALKTQIADLNAQIGREQAAAACPTCGAAIQEGDQFCRECGGKL